jgi:hypothetical protein
MPYLPPQTLLNYLIETNKPLSIDELGERFDSVTLDDILQAANALEMNGLVDKPELHVWVISDKTKKMLKDQDEKQKREDEKTSKEIEKLHLEIDELVNRLTDYDTVKKQAKWAIIFAAVSAAAALIALLK